MDKMSIQKIHYIALAILLLLCLGDMPYGYYALVRFVGAVSCAYWAYLYYKQNNTKMMWIFIIITVLFQPFWKIALGRDLWNIVDVVLAIYLIVMAVKENRKI